MSRLSTQEDAGVLLVLGLCRSRTQRVSGTKSYTSYLYYSEFKMSRSLNNLQLYKNALYMNILSYDSLWKLSLNSCQHSIVYSHWSIFSDDSICFYLCLHKILGLVCSCSPHYITLNCSMSNKIPGTNLGVQANNQKRKAANH